MNSFPIMDYYFTFLKKSTGTATEFSGLAFEKFEKINDLNIKYSKNLVNEAGTVSDALYGIKDANEFFNVTQDLGSAIPAKASAYYKELYKVNAELLKASSEYVETESGELSKVFTEQVNEMTKNAPAGTEGVVAMTKSSLAATSSTYESMTKAAKQVFELVDNNIEAASKASETVVSPATAKPRGKKAA